MAKEKMLNPREAAQRLNVGLQRLYVLLYSGKLRAEKQGNRWMIPASAITERLQRMKTFRELQGASAEDNHDA
ncbi:MAG TPA: helix-turn-helix domain-containing protein [Candidatus Acidoferrales bacterium]|nr:helix-turn-helix domain-containing protein [Candidatus Acidoferrales bacterium]